MSVFLVIVGFSSRFSVRQGESDFYMSLASVKIRVLELASFQLRSFTWFQLYVLKDCLGGVLSLGSWLLFWQISADQLHS